MKSKMAKVKNNLFIRLLRVFFLSYTVKIWINEKDTHTLCNKIHKWLENLRKILLFVLYKQSIMYIHHITNLNIFLHKKQNSNVYLILKTYNILFKSTRLLWHSVSMRNLIRYMYMKLPESHEYGKYCKIENKNGILRTILFSFIITII